MQRCSDLSPADWLVSSATPWTQLVTFGPSGFGAYGRLRFLPDPAFVGQRENEVVLDAAGPSELELSRRTLLHLARFTSASEECYVCVWEGIADDAHRSDPLVALPHRRYALLRGALEEITRPGAAFGSALAVAPAFVWPADHAWCFASDIDPHWAAIGSDRSVIDALAAETDIDVVYAEPTRPPAAYV